MNLGEWAYMGEAHAFPWPEDSLYKVFSKRPHSDFSGLRMELSGEANAQQAQDLRLSSQYTNMHKKKIIQ